jgi:primosomal protein N'
LVVSTYGVEPRGRYAAIIFLDLEQQVSRADLRGLETVRENVFRNLSMIENSGEAYLSLPASHSLCQDVIKMSPYRAAEREIDERNAAHLPPHYDVIQVLGGNTNNSVEGCSTLIRELEKELEFLEIIGPYQRDPQGGTKTLLIKCLPRDRHRVIGRLTEINRVNSLRSTSLFTIKIDPYSLA